MQHRSLVLVYKINMHPGSTMNPEQCTTKADRAAMRRWLGTTLKQLDQHQATASPPPEQHYDEEMQEQHHTPSQQKGELPPSGSGTAAPAQTQAQQELKGGRAPAIQVQQVPTRLSFEAPYPPGPRGNQSRQGATWPTTHRWHPSQGWALSTGTNSNLSQSRAAEPTKRQRTTQLRLGV